MIQNYLKISFRNLRKHKSFSLINVAGLALGMVCCIILFLYIQDEISYDRYHSNADRIYRVVAAAEISGETMLSAMTALPWGTFIQKDFPEVISYVRMMPPQERTSFSYNDKTFFEDRFYYADKTVFDIFSWDLINGDIETALTAPLSVVLSESTAEKYFGNEDPIGKSLKVMNTEVTITGVMRNIPQNSHMKSDFFVSISTLNVQFGNGFIDGENMNSWWWRNPTVYTFLLLPEDYDPKLLDEKLAGFVQKYTGEELTSRGISITPYLQQLNSIHFTPGYSREAEPATSYMFLSILALVGLFILTIACINFTNLSTARSALRAREVGMRKVLGARREQLIKQFLGEAVIISVIALITASVAVLLLLPQVNGVIGKNLVFSPLNNPALLFGLAGFIVFLGLAAGLYPAFFLSAYLPVNTLKGVVKSGQSGGFMRKLLVVFQFTISVTFIIGTIIVYDQLDFMKNKHLRTDKDQIVIIPPAVSGPVMRQYVSVKNELVSSSDIIKASASGTVPGRRVGGEIILLEGKPPEEARSVRMYSVDLDYFKTYEFELAAGRAFSPDVPTDWNIKEFRGRKQGTALIINETAARMFGWNDPEEALGKRFLIDPRAVDFTGTVIGVAKDYYHSTLHREIPPVVLYVRENYDFFSIRISTENSQRAIDHIQAVWKKFAPEVPFEFSFIDQDFQALYRNEDKLVQLFGYISFIAIFIGSLGLLGLVSFTANTRTKEIGIRKTLGASVPGIVRMIAKEFTLLVFIANIIAWPITYFAMNYWLRGFAYRTTISIDGFILAAAGSLIIAVLTVAYQSIKAARTNPVETLRYE